MGPKQALEIQQQPNGRMWMEFITMRRSRVVNKLFPLKGCRIPPKK